MQQTQKYKLNLIESSDPFLPDALNQNTQKVEDAMSAHEEKVGGQVADLDARVAVFEAKHFAFGQWLGGTSHDITVPLDFSPKAVLVSTMSSNLYANLAVIGRDTDAVKLEQNGFCVTTAISRYGSGNYIAFG